MPTYFQGQNVASTVKLAAARTFRDLVGHHINVAVPLHCTRELYWQMPEATRDAIKMDSPYLTPAVFKTSPARRVTGEAVHCNLIFLDIDAKDGKTPAKPYVQNPATLVSQLAPFAFCAYHTINSTPEAPRIRIVVSADKLPVMSYAAAAQTIARKIGLPDLTKESKVAVQAMFMPSLFADEEEHPMFVQALDGKAFTEADIDDAGDFFEDLTPGEPKKKRTVESTVDNLFAFLRAPLDDVTLETAAGALDHMDPDMDYRDWLNVAAALRHQFDDQPDEAYALFDVWSSKGVKYAGEDETEAKWRSFDHTPLGRLPVTIRTVLHMAQLAGWDSSPVKDKAYAKLEAWIKDAATVNLLLSEALVRIVAAPLLSQTEEDALLHAVIANAKKRFGTTVSITSLRRDVNKLKAQQSANKPEQKIELPAWAMGLCYITAVNQFFRHRTGERFGPDVADRIYAKNLTTVAPNLADPSTSRPEIKPQDALLNMFKVPIVWDEAYDPSQPNDLFFEAHSKVFVNTYRRTHPDSKPERAAEAGALFSAHLCKLFSEPDYRRILTDYFAYIVQHPGQKVRWCPLIQGAEGCGKSVLADSMAKVLGKEHVISIGGQEIFSGYTEWATGTQFIALEEVRVVGQNRFEVMNVMKPLITNQHITIKQRYRDTREVVNRGNYIMFTNHHDALAVTANDRRYFVLKSAIQTKEQVKSLVPAEYFKAFYAMLHENAGGLRAWFEAWEISPDFDPDGHAPATIYLQQLVKDSASDTASAVRKLLLEGDHPLVQADMVSAKVLLEMIHNSEGLGNVTPQHLAGVLRDEGFTSHDRISLKEGNDDCRHYIWVHVNASHLANEEWRETARVRVLLNMRNLATEILL